MAEKTKLDIDSPAGYNGGNGPGNATKLPTKHYPSSGNMGKSGSKTTIEGPCEDHAKGYHK